MIRALVVALLLLPGSAAETKKTKWTILVYINGDTNLELCSVYDVEGMIAATHSDDVAVVLQFDRAVKDGPESEWFTGRGIGQSIENWHTTKRIRIDKDGATELEDLGKTNTGDPKPLAEFIAWGVKNHPADRTMLVMQDHGAGWLGWGQDLSHNGDMLSLDELSQGLRQGLREAGLERFDLLLFQACLMGCLEVARTCRPYAKWILASEEYPYFSCGPKWRKGLSALSRNPDMETPDFAQTLAKAWKATFDDHSAEGWREIGTRLCFSVTELDRLDEVLAALGALCDGLVARMDESGRDAWLKIAAARNRTEEFGKNPDFSYFMIDLHHFAENLGGLGVDAQRARLRKAIEACVRFNVAGPKHPNARGISTCFPATKSEFQSVVASRVDYAKTAGTPKWAAFLAKYYELQSGDKDGPVARDTRTSKKKLRIGQMAQFNTTVESTDVAEMSFVLAQPKKDGLVLFGRYPVKENEGNDFDGTWLAFGNSRMMLWACVLSYEVVSGRTYVVGAPARYLAPGADEEREITIFFSATFDENWKFTTGKFLYAYDFAERGPAPVVLRAGGRLRAVYLWLSKGKEERTVSNETIVLDRKGLVIREFALHPGEYTAGFEIVDLAGNVTRDWVEFELVK